MSWTYRMFWAAVAIASLSLVACGQMKEENNGRPAVQQPAGGSPAATSGGTGPAATSAGQGTVANTLVKIEVKNIQKTYIGGGEQGFEVRSSVLINGAEASSIMTVQNPETQANVDGFVGYFVSGKYVVTYASKCNDINCDQYFITLWVSDTSKGVNELQLGVMKDMNGKLINAKDSSDQLGNTITGASTGASSYSDNMKSLQSMIDLLKSQADSYE